VSVRLLLNCKGLERKRSWPNQSIIPEFSWRDLVKRRKTSIRLAGVRAEIRTRYFPNTTVEPFL
jgi:hypothetical protein